MNTQSEFCSPAEFARFVQKRLRDHKRRPPSLGELAHVIEVAFLASMKTEEAQPIRCNLIFLNAKNPDPHPPETVLADRWSVTRFTVPVPLNVQNLAKIAKSFDKNASALAVGKDETGQVTIWGALDQQGWRTDFKLREKSDGAECPGILEVIISGVGTLDVFKSYWLVATLRQGRLTYGSNDVFGKAGPIKQALNVEFLSSLKRLKAQVGNDVFNKREHWIQSFYSQWTTCISRILLGIQKFGHGGAVLLTPTETNKGLSIKYRLEYDRLYTANLRCFKTLIERTNSSDDIFGILESHAEEMPVSLYLDESVAESQLNDLKDEITGCIRFISALSRVDGILLMNGQLKLRGYGAIINDESNLAKVWLANEPAASTKMRSIPPTHYGTRHQSMMRICYSRAGSIGFVVSQDGEVKAMTRVGQKLVIWEDIGLTTEWNG